MGQAGPNSNFVFTVVAISNLKWIVMVIMTLKCSLGSTMFKFESVKSCKLT